MKKVCVTDAGETVKRYQRDGELGARGLCLGAAHSPTIYYALFPYN